MRYGDHTLNQMINKIQSSKKTNIDMEDIMHMNELLKPYQEKANGIDPDNIKDKCSCIEVI